MNHDEVTYFDAQYLRNTTTVLADNVRTRALLMKFAFLLFAALAFGLVSISYIGAGIATLSALAALDMAIIETRRHKKMIMRVSFIDEMDVAARTRLLEDQ